MNIHMTTTGNGMEWIDFDMIMICIILLYLFF